jgi:hypothetical protein
MARTSTLGALLRRLAGLYPLSVEPSDDLDRRLGFLGAAVEAATLVRAGYGAGLVSTVLAGLVAALVGVAAAAIPPLAVATGLAIVQCVHALPSLLASLRRTRALGAAPAVVGRLVLRMRVDPAVERAAVFAGRAGDGPLADSLAEHARRARGTPRTGLAAFADEWTDWFPALERAAGLVSAAAAAPAAERDRTLDRALAAVLDGTRDRLAAFGTDVTGPTTAVYAFGVLLPVALVGLLPAASVAGLRVSLPAFVAVYDVVLPLGLLAAAAYLLARRPVAFPPPRVDRSHPSVPDRRLLAPAAGLATGAAAWTAAGRLIAAWAAPIAALGVGSGTALLVWYRPVKRVRDRTRAVEADLDDALYLVGRRVAAGVAVEAAIDATADEVDAATGEVLRDAVGTGRRLGVGVRASFVGEHGALGDVPSARARGAAVLLGLAADTGRPAGEALVALASHLGDLRELEAEARRELAQVTGTLRNTGAVFAPIVAGATVALAGGIRRAGGAGRAGTEAGVGAGTGVPGGTGALAAGSTLRTAALGPAVGVYVLLLAATLTALATGLSRGLDRSLVGFRLGLALPTATAAYLVSFVAAGLLL